MPHWWVRYLQGGDVLQSNWLHTCIREREPAGYTLLVLLLCCVLQYWDRADVSLLLPWLSCINCRVGCRAGSCTAVICAACGPCHCTTIAALPAAIVAAAATTATIIIVFASTSAVKAAPCTAGAVLLQ